MCLELLVKRGFYTAASSLIESYYKKNLGQSETMTQVRSTSAFVRNEIDRKIKLAGNTHKLQNIKPAWLWGQNRTHIVFHVKFAYKHHLTGCSDIFNVDLSVQDSTLNFSASGIQNSIPIKYTLNLPL